MRSKKHSLGTPSPSHPSNRSPKSSSPSRLTTPTSKVSNNNNNNNMSLQSPLTPNFASQEEKKSTKKTRPPLLTPSRELENQNDGLYFEKLQQRENNLFNERQKLELAKFKLHTDFSELEKSRKNLEEEENEMNGFNQQMMKDQADYGKQSIYLQKMASDLQKQLEHAEVELEDYMLNGQSDPKIAMRIENFQNKVNQLKKLNNFMQKKIISKENIVIQKELAAIDHERMLEEADRLKEQIDLRRIHAMNKKYQLSDIISRRNQKLSQMESSFDSVRQRFDEAQKEKERLNKLAARYNIREQKLEERREKLIRDRKEYEEKMAERIQAQKNLNEQIEQRQRDMAEHPMDLSFDLKAFEIEVVNEENSTFEKLTTFEEKRKETMNVLIQQRDKLIEEIKSLNINMSSGKSINDMLKELNEIQNECAISKGTMDQKQKEIDELKRKVLSEEEVEKRTKEVQSMTKRILALEREINSLQSRIQTDEDTIEGEEESMRQIKDEIESEKRMTQLKENAANKMLSIYKQQLETSADRYQTLLQQIENCNLPSNNNQ